MALEVSQTELAEIHSMSEEELARSLVLAAAGTQFDQNGEALSALNGSIGRKSVASFGWLDWAGRIFDRMWTAAKTKLCAVYENGGDDLVDLLVDAAQEALGIPGKLAAYLVEWAIRKGVDALCAI